jgi:hypothetical protein
MTMTTRVEAAQAKYDRLIAQQRHMVEANIFVGPAEQGAMDNELRKAERALDLARAHAVAPDALAMANNGSAPPPPAPQLVVPENQLPPSRDSDAAAASLMRLMRAERSDDPMMAALATEYERFAGNPATPPVVALVLAALIVSGKAIKAHDARIVELEARKEGVRYRGTFQPQAGQLYTVGDMVTHAGSMWHCNADTVDVPGNGSKCWTLAVKRGRDGKDVR